MTDPISADDIPLIELRGAHKRYGNHVILDGIDLCVYRGEALAIIGPSGTGKSTVLRVIAGLLALDAGEIYVQGQQRKGLIDDGEDPIGISMVFQEAALFDSLTVAENVGFFLHENSHLSDAKIHQLVAEKLEMVGLGNIGDRYPAELSGGMRKRVSVARAIMTNPESHVGNPEIILYDEPTAGLDPIASTMIEDLVRQLQRSTQVCNTYVLVSHVGSTIQRTADRVLFLYDGRIQWEGHVAEIETTDNPLIRQFFSASVSGPIQVAP